MVCFFSRCRGHAATLATLSMVYAEENKEDTEFAERRVCVGIFYIQERTNIQERLEGKEDEIE